MLLSLKNTLHPNTYSYTQQAVGNMSPEFRTQDGAAGEEMEITEDGNRENHAGKWVALPDRAREQCQGWNPGNTNR